MTVVLDPSYPGKQVRLGWLLPIMCVGCADIFDLVTVEDVDAAPDSAAPPGACPAAFGASLHLWISAQVSWREAADDCTSRDVAEDDAWFTHLVVISSPDELLALGSLASNKAWVGYTDIVGTTPVKEDFLWITNEGGFALWATGQPDEVDDAPYCAYRDFDDGMLHDSSCAAEQHGYLCECDGYAALPTNIPP